MGGSDAAIAHPRRLGRYEILGELARGGMASVHLGRVTAAGGFSRVVAVKCCHAHLSDDPEFVSMFFDEARIAASIHHPNVVATLDVGEEDGVLYHVMEYVEGVRLIDLVKAARSAGEPLPIGVVARVMVDALHGLHAAHELVGQEGTPLDVVHRDISPQNIMVGADGISRIMDFGIARAAARTTVTDKGVVKGKFSYMAPEQLLAQPIDRRCDLFAAGIVMWEALAGKRLFTGDSQGETVHRVLHVPVDPPSRIRSDAAPLDAIVMRALARSIDDRWPTALEMAEAIESAPIEMARASAVGAKVRAIGAPGSAERKKLLGRRDESQSVPSQTPSTTPDAEPPIDLTRREETGVRRRAPVRSIAVGAVIGLVLAAIALAVALSGGEDPITATPLTAPAPPVPEPVPVPVPVPEPVPERAAAEPEPEVTAPAPASTPAATDPAAARPTRTPRATKRRDPAPPTRPAQGEYIPRAL